MRANRPSAPEVTGPSANGQTTAGPDSTSGLTLDLLKTGEALIRLQRQSREWVKRRIEVVRFEDHLTIQRATTLDLEISPEALAEWPKRRGRVLLPVTLVDRSKYLNVTVFNTADEALPQVGPHDERSLIAAGLVYKHFGDNVVDETRDGGIVEAAERMYGQFLTHLDAGPTEDQLLPANDPGQLALERYEKHRLVIAAVDADGKTDGLYFRVVVQHPEPLQEPPSDKEGAVPSKPSHVGVAQGGPSSSPASPRQQGPWWRRWAAIGGDRLEARVLKVPVDEKPIHFPVRQLEDCESFHFEVIAPDGAYVDRGALAITVFRKQDDGTFTLETLDPIQENDPHVDRAHFFFRSSKHLPRDEVILSEASIDVVLRPMTMGMMVGPLCASLLGCGVLLFLLFTVGWAEMGWPALFQRSLRYHVDVNSLVTVLVLGPTLLSGIVVRQGENLMAKRILSNHRRRVALVSLATFVASLVFALGIRGIFQFAVLISLSAFSCLTTALTISSFLRSQWGLATLGQRVDRSEQHEGLEAEADDMVEESLEGAPVGSASV